MLDLVEIALRNADIKFERLDGGMTLKRRGAVLKISEAMAADRFSLSQFSAPVSGMWSLKLRLGERC